MIRWKGIATFAGLIVIIFILSLFFTDKWLESQLEDAGSSLVGAKVEIDGLNLEFFDMLLELDHLQITDRRNTMKNIVETGHMRIDAEFWPLLSGKVIIEEISIKEFQSNTTRKTDGKIERTFTQSTKELAGETASLIKTGSKEYIAPQLSGLGKSVNTDSIMARMHLSSVDKMDSLSKELEAKYKKWDERIKNLDIEKDINTIKTESKKIDTKNLKDLVKLKESLQAVEKIRKSTKNLNSTYKNLKKDFDQDYKFAKTNWSNVNQWIANDYKNAMAMANIPDFSVENMGKIIFGQEVMGQYYTYMGYLNMAREYLAPSEDAPPKEEKPQRFEGQNIRFVKRSAEPDWWIKKINLSGYWNDIMITGSVTDIVSNQKQINKKTILKAGGKGKKGASVDISGYLDYLTDVPNENLRIGYGGFSLKNKNLTKSAYLPGKVDKGYGYVESTTDIKGELIEGMLDFSGRELSLKTGNGNRDQDRYSKLIQDALADIKTVTMKARIYGQKNNLNFALNSNIDRLVRDAIKKSLSKEVDKAKAKIKKRIDAETRKYRNQLDQKSKKYEKDLKTRLSKHEKQIKDELKVVEDKKKEIEKAIDKQTKDVGKKLKDIFKF